MFINDPTVNNTFYKKEWLNNHLVKKYFKWSFGRHQQADIPVLITIDPVSIDHPI